VLFDISWLSKNKINVPSIQAMTIEQHSVILWNPHWPPKLSPLGKFTQKGVSMQTPNTWFPTSGHGLTLAKVQGSRHWTGVGGHQFEAQRAWKVRKGSVAPGRLHWADGLETLLITVAGTTRQFSLPRWPYRPVSLLLPLPLAWARVSLSLEAKVSDKNWGQCSVPLPHYSLFKGLYPPGDSSWLFCSMRLFLECREK
jgi:hypothetical protein